MSHRLLWLPAVLHRQDQLGVHQLLQHSAVQRPPAQEEIPALNRGRPGPRRDRSPLRPPPPPPGTHGSVLTDLLLLLLLYVNNTGEGIYEGMNVISLLY